MNQSVIHLQLWQLIAAYVFILILTLIVKWRGIPREKEIVISTARMTIQLIFMAYILTYLLQLKNIWLTMLVIVIMEAFAIINIMNRVKVPLQRSLKKRIVISMSAGTLLSMFYFIFAVIRPEPWYDPRYFIPIAGMIIGNSMTGITLGVDRLVSGMQSQRHLIEGALMLGAKPHTAAKSIVNEAFDAAILPTINSMVGMGIVFIPGLMTGQILSGVSPLTAITYQIAIMLCIAGSVSLSVFLFVQTAYRSFFNEQSQFMLMAAEEKKT